MIYVILLYKNVRLHVLNGASCGYELPTTPNIMDHLINHIQDNTIYGNWDWQPLRLKEQFGQLTLSDVTFKNGRERDMLTRIGVRLNKTLPEVIQIIRKLKSF